MIAKAATVGIYVSDQNRALEFEPDTLGFEKRVDEPMGDGARWIEVAPEGAETRLVLFTPPGLEGRIGTWGNMVFECGDIRATHEELRGRGVEFTQEPSEQPWGLWTQFKDVDGNKFDLIQA